MSASHPIADISRFDQTVAMQPAKLIRYGTFGLFVLVTMAWLGMLPIALLGIGFGGGELLSPTGLILDLRTGDLYWATRIWAWFTLAWPVVLFVMFWRLRRSQ